MKKLIPIGLLVLLLCHMLAAVVAGIGAWWQARHDLSERLQVYRSVDSMVEFQVPLSDQSDDYTFLPRTTDDGFKYQGTYYEVVSLEVAGNTLHITAMEAPRTPFWQRDLCSFLNNHLQQQHPLSSVPNQLLKLLLKEYSPGQRLVMQFLPAIRPAAVRIPGGLYVLVSRALAVQSPPPK